MAAVVFAATGVLAIDAEAALIRAAQSGDRAAFGRLYERYSRMVHGVLLAYVSYSDAEDLVQDVFLTALERISALRDPQAAGGWLMTIARHAAVDFHRSRRKSEEIDDRMPGKNAPSAEAALALREIRCLPEAYRETLMLRLVEGLTGPEIAAKTGLTPESVRVNLCRGMKMLREKLEGAAHE